MKNKNGKDLNANQIIKMALNEFKIETFTDFHFILNIITSAMLDMAKEEIEVVEGMFGKREHETVGLRRFVKNLEAVNKYVSHTE